jgi:hypothetical protein
VPSDVPATTAVSAVFVRASGVLTVQFNGQLQPGFSAGPQWYAREAGFPGNEWIGAAGSPAVVSGSTVTVHLDFLGQQFNPTLARYTPSPGDLYGSSGVPIAAQPAIPLTVS